MEHRVPRRHERTEAERTAKVRWPVRRRDRRLSHEISVERLQVGLARLDEGRIRERRKEMAPVASDSLAHRPLKGRVGPRSDPRGFVGRDVGRVNRAKGRRDGAAARQRLAARRRMAMDAPSETGKHPSRVRWSPRTRSRGQGERRARWRRGSAGSLRQAIQALRTPPRAADGATGAAWRERRPEWQETTSRAAPPRQTQPRASL